MKKYQGLGLIWKLQHSDTGGYQWDQQGLGWVGNLMAEALGEGRMLSAVADCSSKSIIHDPLSCGTELLRGLMERKQNQLRPMGEGTNLSPKPVSLQRSRTHSCSLTSHRGIPVFNGRKRHGRKLKIMGCSRQTGAFPKGENTWLEQTET